MLASLWWSGCLPARGAQRKPGPVHPLSLNRASAAELQQIPGIGPKRAAAIVRFRQKSGPFRRVEDLLAIRGISRKLLEKIRPYVFVELPPQGSPNGKPPRSVEERRQNRGSLFRRSGASAWRG